MAMAPNDMKLGGYKQTYNDGTTLMYEKRGDYLTYYYLEGNVETMDKLMNKEMGIWHPSGYSTDFCKIGPNTYKGMRLNSCD